MKCAVPYYSAELIAEKSWMIRNSFSDHTEALCYLIEGKDCALLIDSIMGMGNLKAFCATLTNKPVMLVNTHAHPDHIGGNFFFDRCYMPHRDIGLFQDNLNGATKASMADMARESADEKYRELIVPDDNFADWAPMKVYPYKGGDAFDLGDRRIEAVDVRGHTAGSMVLIDPATRIAYSGDACNGNTLLEFPESLPVSVYMQSLLRLKEHQSRFDRMYGGHQIFDSSIIDEAIETVGKVIAGTDDHEEAVGMMGNPVWYAAARVRNEHGEHGYARADGKRFNMSYIRDKILGKGCEAQIIRCTCR